MFNKIIKNFKKKQTTIFNDDAILELNKKGLDIIKKQIADIDYKGNNETELIETDELIRAELLVTKRLFLENFFNTCNFLLKKVQIEDKKDLKYFLPNVRVLVEIYVKLIYLASKDKNEQMMICLHERLSDAKQFCGKEQFDDYYNSYQIFFNFMQYKMPPYADFSKKKLNNFLFKPIDQMINRENINSFKPSCFKENNNISETIYSIYRGFSNYAHGNILTGTSFGNEYTWIIKGILPLIGLTATLIDKSVLDGLNSQQLDNWIKEMNKYL